jgi:hypothetical protein
VGEAKTQKWKGFDIVGAEAWSDCTGSGGESGLLEDGWSLGLMKGNPWGQSKAMAERLRV